MKFSIENANKIKLIIWDLDETFWRGTLSDNNVSVQPIQMNIDLVKRLSNRGIVNAVCSKNDREPAEKKLEDFGVKEYFVFNSINWEPKGERIRNLINDMALRPANVLFLDDNKSNQGEAEFVLPELMVSGPEVIPSLLDVADTLGKDDSSLSRLDQYKVLEKKREIAQEFGSNLDFLRQSNIRVQFSELDEDSIPRIAELIQRSNQLNFTKNRIGEDELRALMNDDDYDTQYLRVTDNYGVYGIVGFYALEKNENRLDHFVFSCRTMGMGIEQFVYASLGYPGLDVVGPVSGEVSEEAGLPDYVHVVDMAEEEKPEETGRDTISVLLKGPCDLSVMASYIEGGNVALETEFNFIDKNGNQADYYNHLVNILNDDRQLIGKWCESYSFLSPEVFETNLFSGNYDVICLSPLMDATLAVYADNSGNELAYGLYSKPMSDKRWHQAYLNKKVMTARSTFKAEELEAFSGEFRQTEYSPAAIAENLRIVIDKILESNSSAKTVILLLSELEYESNNPEYLESFANKHLLHSAINEEIRKTFAENSSVYLLDVNKYIRSQSDYFDNINHYSKYVYYKMAKEFASFMREAESVELKTASKAKALYQNLRRAIYKKLFVK